MLSPPPLLLLPHVVHFESRLRGFIHLAVYPLAISPFYGNDAAANAATKAIPPVIIQRIGNLGTKPHFAIAAFAANFASRSVGFLVLFPPSLAGEG